MDTNIRFEPSGKGSLVASGQTILGAARSVGVEIPAECGAMGECDSCAVFVESGADGLSAVTDAERTYLSETRLAEGERLACQAQLTGPEVTVRVPEILRNAKPKEEKETVNETTGSSAKDNLREEFDKLPFDQKMSALADFGLNAAGDVVGVILKTTQRIGNELSSMFSGDSKTEQPPEQSQSETQNPPKENDKGNDNA